MATKARHLKTPVQLWVADNRKRLKLESLDLAQLTGVTEDTARGWESRGRPSQDALEKLASRFGVPIPEGEGPVGGDQTAVVAAIDRQSKVMQDLAAAIWTLVGGRPTGDPLEQDLRTAALLGDAEAARRVDTPARPAPDEPARPPVQPLPGNGPGS